ncbi:hypothetical protein [Psychrobacter sp. DAB_AL43B]|uniref:hypothetical protein n=1 Tax=Psychrobacter sp. DAB_AL43B TaxID=1028416 RepID=UPI0009A5B97D|nr:hypothetical protein [Psychrobacter sp. DAB_AL43B]
MKLYEVYGTFLDLVSAKEKIEVLCSLKFEENDSSYYGTYYICGKRYKEESFQVVNNLDLLNNKPLEEDNFPVVLYINNIKSDKNKIIAESKDFVLISREEV